MDGIRASNSLTQMNNVGKINTKPQTSTQKTNSSVETAQLTSSNAKVNSQFTGASRPSHASPTNSLNFGTPIKKSESVASKPETQSNQRALEIVNSLKPHASNPTRFAQEVNKFLQNPKDREALIEHYGLDSKKSKEHLGIAMFLEAGQGLSERNMKPVGAAILNRVIGNNLALEASGSPRRVTVANVMAEKGQFESFGRFNKAIKGNSGTANLYGKGSAVQSMVNELMKGDVGANQNAETAFYFRRGKMKNQTMSTPDGHSFATKFDSGLNYIGNNYLTRHTGKGFK